MGWIPIYSGQACHDGNANNFACFNPSCTNLPPDECGPNSCNKDSETASLVVIIILVVAIVGGICACVCGIFACYKAKCCCWSKPKHIHTAPTATATAVATPVAVATPA